MKAYGLAAALLLTADATSAPAQDASRGDAFAGYSMLASDSETKHGWHAALGWGLSGSIGLLLDLSGHQGSDAEGTDVGVLSLMAGPRVTFGSGRVRPFVHVIGGIVRSKASISVFAIEISESSTDLGAAAGAGFDLGFGGRWAVRLAADYRVVPASPSIPGPGTVDGESARDPRFSAGVVYRFGAR